MVCTLATIKGDKPHVRGIMVYRADDNGVLFHTGQFKELFKQLQNNPNVELCFIQEDIQIRISGQAVLENDIKIKEEIVSKRPFLKPVIEKNGYDAIRVFRVENSIASVLTKATNLAPKEYITIKK